MAVKVSQTGVNGKWAGVGGGGGVNTPRSSEPDFVTLNYNWFK